MSWGFIWCSILVQIDNRGVGGWVGEVRVVLQEGAWQKALQSRSGSGIDSHGQENTSQRGVFFQMAKKAQHTQTPQSDLFKIIWWCLVPSGSSVEMGHFVLLLLFFDDCGNFRVWTLWLTVPCAAGRVQVLPVSGCPPWTGGWHEDRGHTQSEGQ